MGRQDQFIKQSPKSMNSPKRWIQMINDAKYNQLKHEKENNKKSILI
tara:strand:- start:5114 stop:5254 length:141 start_codon:yes stop_codon:yes gene_type:complete